MPLLIREAEFLDAAAIARVHVAAWQTAYPGMVPAELLARFTEHGQTSRWQKVLTTPEAQAPTLVAIKNAELAGFVCVGPSRTPELGYPGEIMALNVHPDFWGQGVAEPLLRAGVNWLLKAGYTDMHLWVVVENVRARRFYEHVLGPGVIPSSAKVESGIHEISYGWRRMNGPAYTKN
jgi:GNAT superfamily N-acetyltransferase